MLIGCMLVRNEQGRWLETVLQQMKSVCDKIIILDDGSIDNTPEISRQYGEVFYSDRSYWGTNELKQRKLLWELATSYAINGDWILCMDADETIPNIDKLPEMIGKADALRCDGIGFRLYDMWDGVHYRDDELWNAHNRDWVMCVKYISERVYIWRNTKLHCGRFPENAVTLCGNTGLALQHWGWSRPADRQIKYERYMKVDSEGKTGSLDQYRSILDANPNLIKFKGE